MTIRSQRKLAVNWLLLWALCPAFASVNSATAQSISNEVIDARFAGMCAGVYEIFIEKQTVLETTKSLPQIDYEALEKSFSTGQLISENDIETLRLRNAIVASPQQGWNPTLRLDALTAKYPKKRNPSFFDADLHSIFLKFKKDIKDRNRKQLENGSQSNAIDLSAQEMRIKACDIFFEFQPVTLMVPSVISIEEGPERREKATCLNNRILAAGFYAAMGNKDAAQATLQKSQRSIMQLYQKDLTGLNENQQRNLINERFVGGGMEDRVLALASWPKNDPFVSVFIGQGLKVDLNQIVAAHAKQVENHCLASL